MNITCPKCGYLRQPIDRAPDYECPKCGIIYAKFDKAAHERSLVLRKAAQERELAMRQAEQERELATRKAEQAKELVTRARSTGDWSAFPRDQIPSDCIGQAARNLPITTAHHIPGHEIVKLIDVVSAECVFGVNLIKELFAGVTDFVGGRSVTIQNTLRDAKRVVMAQLKEEAFVLGADGLIAVNLTYSELAGAGKTMLMVVATGTAVTLAVVGEPPLG